jgi:hypothetical protein
MARRIARGLFRLWIVGSVMWICTVGTVTWWTWPNLPGTAVPDWPGTPISKPDFDPDAYLSAKRKADAPKAWSGTPVPDEDITWDAARKCRYTDDGLVHCRTGEATIQTAAEIYSSHSAYIRARARCGLRMGLQRLSELRR